ncbi:hypothetical protein PH210_03535 [Paenibacillus sp. BSR1-1]|uniref:hypothetical protein n=1 Tax=Paenibacillus sp. BSR1-1 TaxID=3020845 RepID=UPI0025B0D4AD|nr:hypothetical protein [Paenibacillus sp. BSR1-1]MDN3015278.1 hypothetical protein [Paenibacillus sp. BSR1-1]
MWYWAGIFALFCCLFLIIEEIVYYLWNRYVYGPNYEGKSKWKNRAKAFIRLFKRKSPTGIHETHKEESPL